MKTTDEFTWDDEYKRAWAPTDDPRVVAVIERDSEYGGGHIDGDVYAPAFYWDRQWGGVDGEAGSTFMDDQSRSIMERLAYARDKFYDKRMPWEVVERYLRIFHATTMAQASSSIDRYAQAVVLNTPTWREHVGYTGDPFADDILAGDVADWTAALDGDVYGVGWAVNEGRRLDDADIDIDDGAWDVTIECWGLLGDDYAQQSAGAFEWGEPNLPEMLPVCTADSVGVTS